MQQGLSRALATVVHDAVLETDARGSIRWMNPAAEALFGVAPGAVIGLPLTRVVQAPVPLPHPNGQPSDDPRVLGGPAGNYVGLRADGTRFPVEVVPTDPSNRVLVVRPLHDRWDLDASLERLFTVSAVMMCVADFDGCFKRVNGAFEAVLGFTADELLQRPFLDFVHPDDRAETVEQMVRLGDRQAVLDFENRYLCRDGSYRVLSWRSVNAGLIYAVARDVTELRAAERLAEERRAALVRANADLQHFVYAASHDLRAPVRGAASLARWIREDHEAELPAPAAENLAALERALARVGQMLADLHAYSQAGRRAVEAEVLDLQRLLPEMVRDLVVLPPGFRIDATDLPVVFAPRTLLTQVFANLVGNAVKHHDRSEGRVQVTARPEPEGWRFAIEDDGPGIDPRHAERVFQVFQTIPGHAAAESSGMGLALVRRVVESLGGTITLMPREGRGARFELMWPARVAAKPS